MKKESFNKENPADLFSQIVKVISRDYGDNDKTHRLIGEIKNISKEFFKIKKGSKEAMYYYDKSNVFRPNKNELNYSEFKCPRCRGMMVQPRHKIMNPIYKCMGCGHELSAEKVLNNQDKIEEYMLENKKSLKEKVIDNVLKENKI